MGKHRRNTANLAKKKKVTGTKQNWKGKGQKRKKIIMGGGK